MVLHGYAAQRVVLALRVPLPVIGHFDASEGGMAIEDDAEEVVGLAVVAVGNGKDAEQDGMCGSASGAATST